MSNVRELALDVFEGREEAEKRIVNGEAKKNILEDYVKEILEIFKISNSSKNSTVLVWQVRLTNLKDEARTQYEKNYLIPMISFEQGNKAQFNNTLVFDCSMFVSGDNEKLKEHINNLQIPNVLFENIFDYFATNLSEYFETTKVDPIRIRIELKRKIR